MKKDQMKGPNNLRFATATSDAFYDATRKAKVMEVRTP
jgi:hypothetical protein